MKLRLPRLFKEIKDNTRIDNRIKIINFPVSAPSPFGEGWGEDK